MVSEYLFSLKLLISAQWQSIGGSPLSDYRNKCQMNRWPLVGSSVSVNYIGMKWLLIGSSVSDNYKNKQKMTTKWLFSLCRNNHKVANEWQLSLSYLQE